MVGEAAMMQRCQDDCVRCCDSSLGMEKRLDGLDTSASDIEGPSTQSPEPQSPMPEIP